MLIDESPYIVDLDSGKGKVWVTDEDQIYAEVHGRFNFLMLAHQVAEIAGDATAPEDRRVTTADRLYAEYAEYLAAGFSHDQAFALLLRSPHNEEQ